MKKANGAGLAANQIGITKKFFAIGHDSFDTFTKHAIIWNPRVLKFSEDKVIRDLQKYVDGTYDKHYAQRKYQATQFIEDCGHGEGFCMGNIMKYAMRYGKKNGKSEKDLLKIMHYALIALYLNNEEQND